MFTATDFGPTAAGFSGRTAVSFAPASLLTITPLALILGSLPLPAMRLTTG